MKNNFKKYDIMLYVALGIFIGSLSTLIFIVGINIYAQATIIQNINASNAISIANTYIVLVTLLFIIWTILITVYTIWFSKWFSREQLKEIKDNLKFISKKLKKDDDVREWFILEIIRDETFEKHFDSKISELLDQILQEKVKDSLDIELKLGGKK